MKDASLCRRVYVVLRTSKRTSKRGTCQDGRVRLEPARHGRLTGENPIDRVAIASVAVKLQDDGLLDWLGVDESQSCDESKLDSIFGRPNGTTRGR